MVELDAKVKLCSVGCVFFTVTNPSDLEPICIPRFFFNCYESQINHHELLSKPQNAEKKASWCTMAAAKEISVDTCNSDS